MYIVVWNRATAQREEFLVLGGARRDAVNTTGVFHTGAKKALVAFHLMGHQVTVASSDDQGDYLYQVQSRRTNIGDIVWGHYNVGLGDETVKECTYTTAIADNAWLSPMNGNKFVRAFGQFVLNAVGTSPNSWGILKNVEAIELAPEGFTRVYVPQTPEIEEIVDDMDSFFSWGREPSAEQVVDGVDGEMTVQVFERSDPFAEKTVFYVQGALAYSEPAIKRPFRYAYGILGDTEGTYLSEERHLRSIQKARSLLEKVYARAVRDGNRPMLKCLIKSLTRGEGQLSIWQSSPMLAQCFHEEHGDKTVMVGEALLPIVATKLRCRVIGIASTGLVYSLENSGVIKATETAGIKGGRVEKSLTKAERQAIERDLDLLQKAGLCVKGAVEYHSFTNVDPNDDTIGVHEMAHGIHRVGIHKDTLKNTHERRVALVHEHRHLLTNAGDLTYDFINRADADLVRLAEALLNRKGGR